MKRLLSALAFAAAAASHAPAESPAPDPATTSGLVIRQSLMQNPRSFGEREPGTDIDAIILHHTSAIYWDNQDFQFQFRDALSDFADDPEIAALLEEGKDAYKFDWRFNKQIFEAYGVSAHYIIGRDGEIVQLVKDEDRAYHAGPGLMPPPDNRQSINNFSLGIEITGAHPADDPAVKSGAIPDYTEAQYEALHDLLLHLVQEYDVPLENIAGHDDIGGQRAKALGVRERGIKTDPGPGFQWDRVLGRLAADLGVEAPESPRKRTARAMAEEAKEGGAE
ncbi:MAG: N-acetylmuramoyl-L-alanine amidase [Sumerlaeia bacterium]